MIHLCWLSDLPTILTVYRLFPNFTASINTELTCGSDKSKTAFDGSIRPEPLGDRGAVQKEWPLGNINSYSNPPVCETVSGQTSDPATGWWIPLEPPTNSETQTWLIAACLESPTAKVHLNIFEDLNQSVEDCSELVCVASDTRSGRTTFGTELRVDPGFRTLRTNDYCIVAEIEEFQATGADYYLLVELVDDLTTTNELNLEVLVVDKPETQPPAQASAATPTNIIAGLMSSILAVTVIWS